MVTTIIGVDCAVDAKRVGVAVGHADDGTVHVEEVWIPADETVLRARLVDRLGSVQRGLLAFDAPLGWPRGLRSGPEGHRAGEALSGERDTIFSRATDRFVQARIGKRPLDVGADRIARTAFEILRRLAELRRILGIAIPLAWSPSSTERFEAIEVYPAATLRARGLDSTGYKRATPKDRARRAEILKALDSVRVPSESITLLGENADALDAVVCLLAGADFLAGRALPPEDLEIAKEEGWIWVRASR